MGDVDPRRGWIETLDACAASVACPLSSRGAVATHRSNIAPTAENRGVERLMAALAFHRSEPVPIVRNEKQFATVSADACLIFRLEDRPTVRARYAAKTHRHLVAAPAQGSPSHGEQGGGRLAIVVSNRMPDRTNAESHAVVRVARLTGNRNANVSPKVALATITLP